MGVILWKALIFHGIEDSQGLLSKGVIAASWVGSRVAFWWLQVPVSVSVKVKGPGKLGGAWGGVESMLYSGRAGTLSSTGDAQSKELNVSLGLMQESLM